MVDAGMTHAQIAAKVQEDTGYPVATKTVSAALSRSGNVKKRRYEKELPWRVKTEHLYRYEAQMLRALGKRNAGLPESEFAKKRLDSWLDKLRRDGLVVVYVPNTEEGFFLIRDTADEPGIPVKRELPPHPRARA
jgi:hypothetical protein